MSESSNHDRNRRNSLRMLATAPLLLAGAASAQPGKAPARADGPRVALVLGSGSARGFSHIGVIKALEAARIKPDLIVGTSAGALVGAFYAAGFTGAQMEELAIRVKDIDIVDMGTGAKRGMVMGDTLQMFVNKATRERPIESLGIPFIAVATQLRTGEVKTFRSGDLGLAVRASCSVPGVFM